MTDENKQFFYPPYIQKMPAGHKLEEEKIRFLIRCAAVHASPSGSIGALCHCLGKRDWFFVKQMRLDSPEPLSGETAAAIERLVGKHVAPREELAPHVFK